MILMFNEDLRRLNARLDAPRLPAVADVVPGGALPRLRAAERGQDDQRTSSRSFYVDGVYILYYKQKSV